MKKRKIIAAIVSSIFCISILISSASVSAQMVVVSPVYDSYSLLLPNGTTVQYPVVYAELLLDTPNTNNAVFAYFRSLINEGDMANFANHVDPTMDSLYSSDHKLANANFQYNCHSYAWYSQNTSSNYFFIPSPTVYYSDGSYYEVTTPLRGDIICYFDDMGTPTDYSDDFNLHSGIVTQVLPGVASNNLCGSSNTVIVESKWGVSGLYRHNGYDCPYTDSCLTYQPNASERDRAEYVRYFRTTGHSHSHTTYVALEDNLTFHQATCDCGQVVYEHHNWQRVSMRSGANMTPFYIPLYVCDDCGLESPVIN